MRKDNRLPEFTSLDEAAREDQGIVDMTPTPPEPFEDFVGKEVRDMLQSILSGGVAGLESDVETIIANAMMRRDQELEWEKHLAEQSKQPTKKAKPKVKKTVKKSNVRKTKKK